MKVSTEFLPFDATSMSSGLCATCPRCLGECCNTRRRCGQVLACRAQARSLVVGRYPNGRVRQRPLKRSYPLKKDLVKRPAWELTREKMRTIWECAGYVWVGFLPRGVQVSVRRHLKSGKMCAYYLNGINIHGAPALFLSESELDSYFLNWRNA